MSTSTGSIPTLSNLIQDLLSPSSITLPPTTTTLITYHLTYIPLSQSSNLTSLAYYLATSPSLWKGYGTPSASSESGQEGDGWKEVEGHTTREVYASIRNGVLYRCTQISRESTSWTGRRHFASFLEALLAGYTPAPLLESSSDSNSDSSNIASGGEIHPTIRLIISSAILSALQAIKSNKEKLYVGGSSLMGRMESEVIGAWQAYFACHKKGLVVKERERGENVPAWLASQTVGFIGNEGLSRGPLLDLLKLLSEAYFDTFAHGHLFSSLSADLVSSPPPSNPSTAKSSIVWSNPSPSYDLLFSLSQSSLYESLGSLSRSIAKLMECTSLISTSSFARGGKKAREEKAQKKQGALVFIMSIQDRLVKLTREIQTDWSKTPWSELDSSDLSLLSASSSSPPDTDLTLPYKFLKSLLFSLILLESSVLLLLSPSPSSVPPTTYQTSLASKGLQILSNTYYVVAGILGGGSDGFGAWEGVRVGLEEVVRRAPEGEGEKTLRYLEPRGIEGLVEERAVARSQITFYLNVTEHLMSSIGSTYLESKVLKFCYPYLEEVKHRDTFESAHSVLLALFANGKPCAKELAPWYTRVLLSAYPDNMSAEQLRLAFNTMIRCISNEDDALAWYCILQLLSSIEAIPISSISTSLLPSSSLLTSPSPTSTLSKDTPRAPNDPLTDLSAPTSLSEHETSLLLLPRGGLLLTLLSLPTSVNLLLLTKLLDQIWLLIAQEAREEREALLQCVFETLSGGMDDTKRIEGVRYWLERGGKLNRLEGREEEIGGGLLGWRSRL